MKEKDFILAARVVSMVFTPFYLPLVGLMALFVFSYMSQLPTGYKLSVLALVYFFTILLPTFLIRFYRRYQGWKAFDFIVKERRMVPYVISIVCYSAAYYTMNALHIPHFMGSILIAALLIQVFCAFINVGWKVSVHAAAIGGVVGALLAFSLIFGFNPLWWLCLTIFISGVVGSSRMLLRQHSLSQVVVAWLIGFFIAFIVIARF
jgi:PAP2 family protein